MTNLQRIRNILDTPPSSDVMVDDVWYGRDKALTILLDRELAMESQAPKPLYYKYPGDGYNQWKVIVQLGNTFIGTHRVYAGGRVLDGCTTSFTRVQHDWQPLTLEQAADLTK